MKQDILTKLNKKRKMWITPKHPLFFEDNDFKILYCVGVFMHAQLNKSNNILNNFELERLLKSGLCLLNKDITLVMKYTNEKNRIVDDIIEILDTPQKKYLFLLDLHNVSIRDSGISDNELQSISIFGELLHLSEKELKYITDFIRNSYNGEKEKSLKVFENMLQINMDITISELKYYIPEIEYVTSIEKKIVKRGANLRLIDNCEIRDTIIVPANTTLHITNCKMDMYGTIVVDGGTLLITDSVLTCKLGVKDTIISVNSFSDVEINNTVIECNGIAGLIKQENGNLNISNTKIFNTWNNSAIRFWGKNFQVENTVFKNCFINKKGSAIYFEKGTGHVSDCTFDNCEAETGGAIYSSVNTLVIKDSIFRQCKARYYGSGIYYNGNAQTNVTNCKFEECLPDNQGIIQYFGSPLPITVSNEFVISLPAIIDQKLIISEFGSLSIINSLVFINYSIDVMGKLNIKKSKIIANNINERDLFNLMRAKHCLLEDSEFDGKLKAGIFKAPNTHMVIRHCMFKNTNGGRAIFNAYEPEIYNTIFSYCVEGALHICAGKVSSCTFVNCRNESGAGIYMYGARGEIQNSKFIRCVATYNGGGITLTGNHSVKQCEFEDCKPNDKYE